MHKGCCFECSKHFQRSETGEPIYTERQYHGLTVKLHKECASRLETARAGPTPHEGRAFSTDDRCSTPDFALEPDTELDFEEPSHINGDY